MRSEEQGQAQDQAQSPQEVGGQQLKEMWGQTVLYSRRHYSTSTFTPLSKWLLLGPSKTAMPSCTETFYSSVHELIHMRSGTRRQPR